MCMYNALKRCGAFVAALVLCFALSVPALADSVLSGSASFVMRYRSGAGPSWSSPEGSFFVSSGSSFNQNIVGTASSYNVVSAGWRSLTLDSSLVPADSQLGI